MKAGRNNSVFQCEWSNVSDVLDSNGNRFSQPLFPGGCSIKTSQATPSGQRDSDPGKHSFRMGYELLKSTGNTLLQSQPGGIFYFGGTANPFTPNTGNDFAALLLGSVVKATFTTPLATWLPRWWSHALYLQDDWKVSPKLTVTPVRAGPAKSVPDQVRTAKPVRSQLDGRAHRDSGAIVHSPAR
jgi:hypothetical protein